MPIITPPVFDRKAQHEDDLWLRKECYRFYVQQRRKHCNLKQLLDLWLLAPVCTDCVQSDIFEPQREPDIKPETWEENLLVEAGKETLAETQLHLLKNPDYVFVCKKCSRQLRPWNGHEMHVVSYHLEEHYGIDLETPGKHGLLANCATRFSLFTTLGVLPARGKLGFTLTTSNLERVVAMLRFATCNLFVRFAANARAMLLQAR